MESGGESRAHYVSERVDGGSWNLLESLTLDRVTDVRVRINTVGADGVVVADAIQFVYTGSGSVPTVTLDAAGAVAYDVVTNVPVV